MGDSTTSGVLAEGEQQSQPNSQNQFMEKVNQGVEVVDACPMPREATRLSVLPDCNFGPSASSIKALNLEPVRGPATARFAGGCVLESFGTSERMSGDVSNPCAM